MTTDDKKILVTNDDGYDAPGIIALSRSLSRLGSVVVVAPDRERSAIGHGLTFFHPLRVFYMGEDDGVKIYTSDGTPTDCVLLAVHDVIGKKPDLVVSGINRGANLGDDVTYSGTVSAAMEGAIQGINSMAVSLSSYEDYDYSTAARLASQIAQKLLKRKLPGGTFLNVNVPAVKPENIKGVKITYQGRSIYHQGVEKRVDPRGREYYWITGAMPRGREKEGTDFWAIKNNMISITPLHLSMSRKDYVKQFEKWNFTDLSL